MEPHVDDQSGGAMMRHVLVFGFASILFLQPSIGAHAEGPAENPSAVVARETNGPQQSQTEFVHVPSTLFGPSGLVFTQSTNTLSPGSFELAVAVANQHSSVPNYNINEVATTLTVGLPARLEFSAHVPYLYNFKTRGSQEDAQEDVDISLKWRFLDQNSDLYLPSLGFSLTYYIPAANNNNLIGVHFGLVNDWGIRALLVSSAEVDLLQPVASYVVGFYFDGGTFVRDTGTPFEEEHGVIDIGTLLPLTESRQLQLILEGNFTINDYVQFDGTYDAGTAALRFVTTHGNISLGIQYRFMRNSGVDDTERLFIQGSYLF